MDDFQGTAESRIPDFRSKLHVPMARRTCPTPVSPRFATVVAYEDVVAAKRAKEICDRLRCSIGGAIAFEMHLWRFDVLRTSGLRDTAVKDAVQARLIMLATRGREELPAETKAWIELWVAQRQARPGALVLLVETIGESANLRSIPQYGYLESVALRARMEFFASISQAARTTT